MALAFCSSSRATNPLNIRPAGMRFVWGHQLGHLRRDAHQPAANAVVSHRLENDTNRSLINRKSVGAVPGNAPAKVDQDVKPPFVKSGLRVTRRGMTIADFASYF